MTHTPDKTYSLAELEQRCRELGQNDDAEKCANYLRQKERSA